MPMILWRRLDKSVRNQVRKAERAGLTVDAGGAEKLGGVLRRVRRAHARSRIAGACASFPRARSWTRSAAAPESSWFARTTRPSAGCSRFAFKDRLAVPWAACLQGVLLALSEHAAVLGNAAERLRRGDRPIRFRPLHARLRHLPLQAPVGGRGRAALLVHDSDCASVRARGRGGAGRRAELASKPGSSCHCRSAGVLALTSARYLTQ